MQVLRIYTRGPLVVLRQGRNEVLLKPEAMLVDALGPDRAAEHAVVMLAREVGGYTSQGVDTTPPAKARKVKDIASGPPEPRR